jgi:MOSC domain-containing protein
MRDVPAPDNGLPPLERSVIACLASILELDPGEVPAPAAGHPEPWTLWRGWLGGLGLGFVPVAEPRAFSWPGPWIALVRSEAHGGLVAAVAFGSPPGIAWRPLGGDAPFEAVERGFVVAPADPALWSPPAGHDARTRGAVEAIVVAPGAEAPAVAVEEAVAHAGRGLEGDRYFHGRGTFSNPHAAGIDLTLVEAEVLEELGFAPHDARRNVVTRGIALNDLVGRRFRVGAVECAGRRLCEPCAHLERLAPGTLRPLVHRGGLRADIVERGVIRVGDEITAIE